MRRKHRKLRRRELKKQRKMVVIAIVSIVCILSVGYAAFSTTLNLNVIGKIKIDDECVEGKIWEFSQKDEGQEFRVPCSGEYKVELWGASENNNRNSYVAQFKIYGGYVAGTLNLKMNKRYYIYVGGQSNVFNAVKNTTWTNSGGATDIRLLKTDNWYDFISLKTRIMVAGGAGVTYVDRSGGHGGIAGGLESYPDISASANPVDKATQTRGGNAGDRGTSGGFGFGGINEYGGYNKGGGGYYGGGGGPSSGGGSSFISGHDGCDAISEQSTEDNIIHTGQSIHYSGMRFTDTVMIDGAGYKWTTEKLEDLGVIGMPTHDGTGTMIGNKGDGFAKITLLTRKPN